MKSLKRLLIVGWCILCCGTGLGGKIARGADGLHAAGIPIGATLTVTPVLPRVDAPVQVTLAGIWSDSCVPSYTSHTKTAHTITISIETPAPEIVCGQAVTPWSITVALGHLSAATYQLQVVGALNMSTEVTVLGNVNYLPLISDN